MVSPFKLALVTETWPAEVNGVAMTLGRLVSGLCDLGNRVQIIRPEQRTAKRVSGEKHLTRFGLPIPGYPALRFGFPSATAMGASWRADPPDVVHVATEGPLGWSAINAAQQMGIPITSTFHTNFHTYSKDYGFPWMEEGILSWLRFFHNRCACTMVPTAVQADELRECGLKNVVVLSRGVDAELFNPQRRNMALRRSWGVSDDQVVMTYVGRIAAEKNLPLVWESFAALRNKVPDARLLLVGDGPLREDLARREGVISVGQRHGTDLAEHYASGDFFAFASMSETYGNVVAEALASGLPCLAFHEAAAAEILADRKGGWTVPPGDCIAFTSASVELGRNKVLRQELAEGAVKTITSRTWASVVNTFRSYLAAAIHRWEMRHAV